MKRQIINPGATQTLYDTLHFATVNRVGDTIWVAGQCGVDLATGTVPADMKGQARLAFEGVRTALEGAGAGLEDIVELMTFHIDLRGEIDDFVAVKDEYLPSDYPAWTAVGVTQLARPEFLVEVRVTAVAGSGRS